MQVDVLPTSSSTGTGERGRTRPGFRREPPRDLSPLVMAARDGDEQAFRGLYRAMQPSLLRYLRVLVGDDAEDVASETWLQIVGDLTTFVGGGDDFRAWSATIARHRALDHLRGRRRRPQVSAPLEVFDNRAGDNDTAAGALDALSTKAAIAMIAKLPRDQAEAVLLRVVIGLDAESAGRILGKRGGAVRTSAYRGLRRLADMAEHLRSTTDDGIPERSMPS